MPAYLFNPDAHQDEFFKATEEIDKRCGGELECMQSGTGWTFVWNLNSTVMFCQALNFLTLTFGAFYFYPRVIGTYCNLLLGTCHLLAIFIAFMSAKTPWGHFCSFNQSPNMFFEDEAEEVFMEIGSQKFLGDSSYHNDAVVMNMLAFI